MTCEPAGQAAFRQRLLSPPGERQHVEHKASLPLQSDDSFSLKLIRHIQVQLCAPFLGCRHCMSKGRIVLEGEPRQAEAPANWSTVPN